MEEEIRTILHGLTNTSKLVVRMTNEVIALYERPGGLQEFAQRLATEIKLATHIQGDDEPFYHFLLAIAYLKLNKTDTAKNSLFHAVEAFKVRDFRLNEALSEWLFARIHLIERNRLRAQHACEAAIKTMEHLIQNRRTEAHYAQSTEYTKYLAQLEDLLKTIETAPPVEVNINTGNQSSVPDEDYIVFPWLPKYDSVRAGPDGLVWVDPPEENSTAIRTIEIDGMLFEIFSTNSSSRVQNRQITLNRNMEYGWAKVDGQSMNATQPVPIMEGDYVLFAKQWQRGREAIVIACRFLADSEQAFMVKKYDAREQTLVSETTDNSQDYSAIDLNEDYQILGTVIAVAKPVK